MRTGRMVPFLLVCLAALGCGGDDGVGPKTIPGTYALVSINGDNVPATIVQVGNDKYEITSGTFTLNANGTFSNTHSDRTTEGGNVSTDTWTCTGVWSQSGNSISLVESESTDCGGEATGEWDGNNTLTIRIVGLEGWPAVYRR